MAEEEQEQRAMSSKNGELGMAWAGEEERNVYSWGTFSPDFCCKPRLNFTL